MKKILFIVLFSSFLITGFAFGAEKAILVIESYHAEYPWDASYKEGIESVLGDQYNIKYFEMDTKRFPAAEHQQRADLAWQEYKKINPALVMLGDDNALKFLGPKFAETDTPVVYLGINRSPQDYGIVGKKNITGVLERPLLKKSVLAIKKMVTPMPKKILVLFDDGTTSQASLSKQFKGHKVILIFDTVITLELIGDLDQWKKTVLEAKKNEYDALVIGLYHTVRDSDGKHVKAGELLDWTVKNTPIPPFGFWDFSVGADKVIGGFVLFGRTQGVAAGKMALEILGGKSPGSINPQMGKKGRFYFSKSKLDEWKIMLPSTIAKKAEFID